MSTARLARGSLVHGFVILAVVGTLLPFAFTVMTSFRTFLSLVQGGWLFVPTLLNWQQLFSATSDFPQLTLNSVEVAVGTTAICVVVGSLAAYSLSRLSWAKAARNLMLGGFLFVQMLPPIMFVGPFYVISRAISIYNTPAGVVMAHLVINLPLVIWMLQSFFSELPKEVEEAAAIDGCSRLQTFWRVALPMALPGLAATAVLSFVFSWIEFLFAVTLTSTPASETIPVGIAGFATDFSVRFGEMAAAATFATIPALIFVGFAQRYIVKGLTLGAVKG